MDSITSNGNFVSAIELNNYASRGKQKAIFLQREMYTYTYTE